MTQDDTLDAVAFRPTRPVDADLPWFVECRVGFIHTPNAVGVRLDCLYVYEREIGDVID